MVYSEFEQDISCNMDTMGGSYTFSVASPYKHKHCSLPCVEKAGCCARQVVYSSVSRRVNLKLGALCLRYELLMEWGVLWQTSLGE